MSDYVTKTNLLSALGRFKENADDLYETKADANDLKNALEFYEEKHGAVFPTWTSNYLINALGTKEAANNWNYSSPIELLKGNTISAYLTGYASYVSVISLCDSDGNNIVPKVIPAENPRTLYSYTATADCYVLLCTKGVTYAKPYIDDHFKENTIVKLNEIGNSVDNITFTYIGKNVFNRNASVKGYLSVVNGTTITQSGDWYTSDYMDVSMFPYVSGSRNNSGVRSTITFYYVCFYREDKTFIAGMESASSPIELPSKTKYIRFSYHNTLSDIQVESNNVITDYEQYTIHMGLSILKNKRWCGIGDSLTEVNSRTIKHYYDYVHEMTGINFVNMGKSGTGYAKTIGTNSFYDRIVNVPTDSDVVTIFGSGNDLSSGLSLGDADDTVLDNTICGYINGTIDALIAIMPRVSLGIVSPCPWSSYPPNTSNAMSAYSNALKEICEKRSIPFLDLYHESNLRPWTSEGRTACYSRDEGNGVHPDEYGHKLIAPRFKIFVEGLVN